MNFPLEYALFRFLHWFVDTAGVGGVVAAGLALGSVTLYGLVLRWIVRGGQVDEVETYTYPTPTLLHDDHE